MGEDGKKIAIIGASNKRERYSNKAVRAYIRGGYSVFPVNPNEEEVEGVHCYPSLNDIQDRIDIVSLYVKPRTGERYINQIIDKGVNLVILNPGSENERIISALKEAGINVRVECSLKVVEQARRDIER